MKFLNYVFPDSLDRLMLMIGAIFGTFFQFAFGGWTDGLKWLILLAILDFFSGTFAALIQGQWNSDAGMKGVIRKVWLFAFVSFAHGIDTVIGDIGFHGFSFMSLIITAFVVTETGSLIENLDRMGLGYVVPPFFRQGIKTIREAAEKKLNNSND